MINTHSRLGGSQEFPRLVHSTCTSSAPALKMHHARLGNVCADGVPKKCPSLQEMLCIQDCVTEQLCNNNSAQEVSKLCKKCLCYTVVCKSQKTHLLPQHAIRLLLWIEIMFQLCHWQRCVSSCSIISQQLHNEIKSFPKQRCPNDFSSSWTTLKNFVPPKVPNHFGLGLQSILKLSLFFFKVSAKSQ